MHVDQVRRRRRLGTEQEADVVGEDRGGAGRVLGPVYADFAQRLDEAKPAVLAQQRHGSHRE